MAKAVVFHELGGPEVLKIEDVPVLEPKAGEVRIKVQAIGLNRSEALFRRGQYFEQPNFPSRVGVEAAGVVDAIGEDVKNIELGDRVGVTAGQGMSEGGICSEYAVVPAANVLRYPENLSPTEGAAIWVQYLTGYFALVDVGNLQAGQRVLITAASSSTGQAAMEMARLLGAKSIATTRTAAKKRALLDAGAEEVIVTDDENIPQRVLEITSGKGVELIYDCVAGDTLSDLAESAARGGKILIYGSLNNKPMLYPLMTAFTRNFTLQTYTLYTYAGAAGMGLPRNEEAYSRGVKFITEHLRTGALKPVIAKTFPLDQIQEAYRYLESNQQIGKVVVTV